MIKKIIAFICIYSFICILPGCKSNQQPATVVATTKPIYDFTVQLCQDTDITVDRLITENVSCLHDYTLQVRQMRSVESAELIIISGAGLEEFLHDVLDKSDNIIDASENIELLCGDHGENHAEEHHHESDPHIWLSTQNARQMVQNIYSGLINQYPQHKNTFNKNLTILNNKFDELEAYGTAQLANLSSQNMITFHDGFSYFALQWNLTILKAVEEESGSEASAEELIDLIELVEQYDIPAIFVEENGSASAAQIISKETNIPVYTLNMGMSDKNYFEVMYQNIDAVKEAFH